MYVGVGGSKEVKEHKKEKMYVHVVRNVFIV